MKIKKLLERWFKLEDEYWGLDDDPIDGKSSASLLRSLFNSICK